MAGKIENEDSYQPTSLGIFGDIADLLGIPSDNKTLFEKWSDKSTVSSQLNFPHDSSELIELGTPDYRLDLINV
jgi:hypothetical protein